MRSLAIYGLLLAGWSLSPAVLNAQTTEPPQTFTLLVNDQPQVVRADQEFKLNVNGETKLKLTVNPHRSFEYGGLQFAYPNSFAFEAEILSDSATWSLDGSTVVLMIFELPETELSHGEMAGSIAASYEDPQLHDCRTAWGETSLVGTKIEAEFAGQKISQEVYSVPTENGARFVVVQDSLTEAGEHSPQYQLVVKTLETSFKIREKAATSYEAK